jgi:hypothetical protein
MSHHGGSAHARQEPQIQRPWPISENHTTNPLPNSFCPGSRLIFRNLRVWLFRATSWHEGGIYNLRGEKYLGLEQFWGRAVRASMTRKSHGRFLIFGWFQICAFLLLTTRLPSKETMADVPKVKTAGETTQETKRATED